MSSLREKVSFYLDDIETTIGLGINLFILGLILLSSVVFIAETYSLSPQLEANLEILNTVILWIFTCEYLLRFWAAEKKNKFFFNIFSLIDLIAILPLFLGWIDFHFLRIFRWFRLLRIIRFWQFQSKLLGIQTEDGVIIARIFLTIFSIIFIYSGLIYQVEHEINGQRFQNFFDAFYFVVVTITTVGYGDVTPLSESGRAMTLLMILTGVLFIPWQLGELIKQFVKTANLVEKDCSGCSLSIHDRDAKFCKQCGTKLND
jgi:voltage-gated potassium channel